MKYFEVHFHISAPDFLISDVRDVMAAMVGDAGFETFEESEEGLTGYVQRELFDEDALKSALQLLPFDDELHVQVDYTVCDAPDRDWNEAWEQEGFEPIKVGTHLIIYDGRHLPTLTSQVSPLTIQIDARQAFGTGSHATTRMMCQFLMDLGLEGKTVLDCGTGTGILSIVSLKCGAESAVGYDIDEWSVNNALHNAALNGVEHCFTSILGDSTVIEKLNQQFDVVVANINRNILLADLPAMRQVMKPEGKLLLSGFYQTDAALLVAKAKELGLQLEEQKEEGEWVSLKFSIQ